MLAIGLILPNMKPRKKQSQRPEDADLQATTTLSTEEPGTAVILVAVDG